MVAKLRRGRPQVGGVDRQSTIFSAAKAAFDEFGYDNASIREIASRAGVDPKLVLHYFGSKAQLFAATIDIPAETGRAVEILGETPRSLWGKALANFLMQPDGRVMLKPLLGVMRSATTDPKVASQIRDFYLKNSMGAALTKLGLDNPDVRAACLSPVLAGFVFADQILEIPVGGPREAAMRRRIFEEMVQTILTADVSDL